ncbi:alternative ribosome rescue factor ArfA [Erythrobacter aureus]|uniref:Ribosome alternative rescue factor ArfA n=1 Tax=Erythrobacter aureus TaxID=2182384 RepID=A0A345YIT0_9SPHN|nr:alternative ribosome rescue factor ArfA [Erythrobacter aureus]AXK43832.1 ribosome alternative rescue factor ArfA [Erythrobacter aureus]
MAAHALKTRNPVAGALRHGNHRHQVVSARKGRGSYTRKTKHKARAFD